MLGGQFADDLGQDVDPVGERVVVEHARQIRGLEDGRDVTAGLVHLAVVDVGRKHHERLGAAFGRAAGDADGFGGAGCGDAGHHGRPAVERGDAGLDDRQLLVELEGVALAQRAERHDAGAAVFDEPVGVLCEEVVIDRHVESADTLDCVEDADNAERLCLAQEPSAYWNNSGGNAARVPPASTPRSNSNSTRPPGASTCHEPAMASCPEHAST